MRISDWSSDVCSSDLAAEPLTTSTTDSTFAISWFPNDARVLYSADQGGNELDHLYVREVDGTTRDLTPGEKVKAGFDGWSARSEEHTSELQSLMRISYAVLCLKKKKINKQKEQR